MRLMIALIPLLLAASSSSAATTPSAAPSEARYSIKDNKLLCTKKGKSVVISRLVPSLGNGSWEGNMPDANARKSTQAFISEDGSLAALFEFAVSGSTATLYSSNCLAAHKTSLGLYEVVGSVHVSTRGIVAMAAFRDPADHEEGYYLPFVNFLLITPTGEIGINQKIDRGDDSKEAVNFSPNGEFGQLYYELRQIFFRYSPPTVFVYKYKLGESSPRIDDEGNLSVTYFDGLDVDGKFITRDELNEYHGGDLNQLYSRGKIRATTRNVHKF